MQKIVLIGGGTGVSELLAAFRKVRSSEVVAVTTVFDNGGSSGVLRKKFGIPAVGDFRRCVSATAGPISKFFEKRLPIGHALGNLALVELVRELGFEKATQIFSKFAEAAVLPVSFSNSQLVGKLESGAKIRGENKFDHPPQKFKNEKIVGISLQPGAKLNPQIKKLLKQADKIVLGPGSLFGSLLVHFAVAGFTAAFKQSRAQKILVLPATREFGYRNEGASEIAARFPVEFDQVLRPTKGSKKWNSVSLIRKIV
ncbi:YvcK family protein [Patescibacteria group bacterium]|nr:YvcK family protein [Patescibacteria group bacterium]